MPSILSRRGPLPAVHPRDGDAIDCGRVYIAPPNLHLVVDAAAVRLSPGPKENGHRPAIDVMFRSAAAAHGPRVIGIVLSGMLADGSLGLREVRRHGGIAVVQDPADAEFSDMPSRAVSVAEPDHVVPADEIPALIGRLVGAPRPSIVEVHGHMPDDKVISHSRQADSTTAGDDVPGQPSGYSCPHCHGVLWERNGGELPSFRCRTGHRLSIESLVEQKDGEAEDALYAALRALEEQASVRRLLGERMRDRGAESLAAEFVNAAEACERRAEIVRRLLPELNSLLLHPGSP
jgi:two-component system chemotaxis response regulator CheB